MGPAFFRRKNDRGSFTKSYKNNLTIPPFRSAQHLPLHKGGLVLSVNPQKSVATVSRREGVYNRAGEPSGIFAEKEELCSE